MVVMPRHQFFKEKPYRPPGYLPLLRMKMWRKKRKRKMRSIS